MKSEYLFDADSLITDARNDKNDAKILADNFKQDGWLNALSGLGTTQDKSRHTLFGGYPLLSFEMLSEMWAGDGMAKKIVSIPADDMTKEGITVQNDYENIISDKLVELKVDQTINLSLKWSRLFGGAIILLGVNDGGLLTDPLRLDNIKSFDYLKVYDRTEIVITNFNFNTDINSPNYGNIEYYTVTPKYGSSFNVHKSRVIELKGIPVPSRLDSGNFYYWGMSVLQPIYTTLADFSAGRGHTAKLLYEFTLGKYKIGSLGELIAEGNEQLLRNRMNAIELSKSIINGVLLGTEEEYMRDSVNVSGLPELLDRWMMYLAGESDIPVTKLFGRSAAGMNSTGEGDLDNYYDMIRAEQKNKLQYPYNRIVKLINRLFGEPVETPKVEFRSLYQETEKEKLEKRKMQSEIDNTYMNTGVLDPFEVRESRFSNGYSFETAIDHENEFELPETSEEQ